MREQIGNYGSKADDPSIFFVPSRRKFAIGTKQASAKMAYLSIPQVLSLLDWLRQNEDTLRKMLQEQARHRTNQDVLVDVDVLRCVVMHVQDENTKQWMRIDCAQATDLQFDTWARTSMQIEPSLQIDIEHADGSWSPEERAYFCNRLCEVGILALFKMGAGRKAMALGVHHEAAIAERLDLAIDNLEGKQDE